MHVGDQLVWSPVRRATTEAGCAGTHVAGAGGRARQRSVAVAAALAVGYMCWGQRPKGMVAELVVAVWECTCWNTWVIVGHEERLGNQEAAYACQHRQRLQQIGLAAVDAAAVVQPEHVVWIGPRLVAAVEDQGQVNGTMTV